MATQFIGARLFAFPSIPSGTYLLIAGRIRQLYNNTLKPLQIRRNAKLGSPYLWKFLLGVTSISRLCGFQSAEA